MSKIIDLSNEIAQRLAEYSAEVMLAPDFTLPKIKDLRVIVCPVGQEIKKVARGCREKTYQIQIGTIQRIHSVNYDGLLQLSESIGNRLLNEKILDCVCIEVSWNPLYDADSIRSRNQFTSVVELTLMEHSAQ